MLDLKYRPQRLSEVLGNEGPRKIIAARIRNGTLAKKSYLLQGPKGAGKTSIARILSKSITCERVTEDGPCGECESCVSQDSGVLLSSEEFDAATQGTVDKMRSIVEELEYGSVDGRPRVVILDEAQRLSKASQDALLRSIEDRRLVVILCTTEVHLIRTAIRSRCEEYTIHYPSSPELRQRLFDVLKKENRTLPEDVVDAVVSKSENCSRVAYSLLETLLELDVQTAEEAASFLGFSPYRRLLSVLTEFDLGPTEESVQMLSDIIRTEGPDFVHDTLVRLSLECEKRTLKVPVRFPVSLENFVCPPRLRNIARRLLERESFSATELELVILEPFLISNPTAQPAPIAPTPSPFRIKKAKEEVTVKVQGKSRTIEVDGVQFSSDERLTSMDDQYNNSTPPPADEPPEAPRVKLDKDRVPMSNQEFSRELRTRLRQSQIR